MLYNIFLKQARKTTFTNSMFYNIFMIIFDVYNCLSLRFLLLLRKLQGK